MTIIGIDPGLQGGIAINDISEYGKLITIPMPVVAVGKKNEIDEAKLVDIMTEYGCGSAKTRVFIEAVHAMPKQGVTSMFTFGTGWGLLRGVCAGMGLSYQLIRPQDWQKLILQGQPKGSEYQVASRLWPGHDFRGSPRCKKPHSGLVDAALIAEYGNRTTKRG